MISCFLKQHRDISFLIQSQSSHTTDCYDTELTGTLLLSGEEILKAKRVLAEIFAKHTGQPVEKIIEEVSATRITERGATRADDRVSEASMEDRKKEGYF